MKGKWEGLCATEHTLDCHGNFNWLNAIIESKDALEIKQTKLDENIKLLNQDEGNLVDLKTWIPFYLNGTLHTLYIHICKL